MAQPDKYQLDGEIDNIACLVGKAKATGNEYVLIQINFVNGLEISYPVFGAEAFMAKQLAKVPTNKN